MSKECPDCITLVKGNKRSFGSGRVRASLSYTGCVTQRLLSDSSVKVKNEAVVDLSQKFIASSSIRSKETSISEAKTKPASNSELYITFTPNVNDIRFSSRLLSSSKFVNTYTSKVSGPIKNIFDYVFNKHKQLLYPTNDELVCQNNYCFVDEEGNNTNLYSHIDGGLKSDDSTYIRPSSIHSIGDGSFKYKCELDNFFIRPDESFLAFRVISPIKDKRSNIVPTYDLKNIILEDPSGNVVIEYKDITVKGDADYTEPLVNYVTYVTEPRINNAIRKTWDEEYPIIGSGSMSENGLALVEYPNQFFESGYCVSFELSSECKDDPFNPGFNLGYEENHCKPFGIERESVDDYLAFDGTPISTQSEWYHLRPVANSIRITAIEMANSGPLMNFKDQQLSFYTEVPKHSVTIDRVILPAQVLDYDVDTSVYPNVSSIWESTLDYDGNVIDNISGSLTEFIRGSSYGSYITLNDVEDSGKLKLKFMHQPPVTENKYTGGAFNFGFYNRQDYFDSAKYKSARGLDNFFVIDSVELKIVAKKANGSDDFPIDVVGWSDDKLLNVTSAIGGFLQNASGLGDFITSSGFDNTDYSALSATPLSEQDQYFESNTSNNSGGDHYKLSAAVVNSTSFKEYTIPLKIYKDSVELGQSEDYSMSSYFENLYLDIYPIPNGASIAHARLIVNYVPSNALVFHVHGQKSFREMINRNVRLFPSSGIGCDIISSSSEILSDIANIPHGYASVTGINGESTLKTNYARRWRGSAGNKLVSSFYDVEFDYSFRKDFIPYPFVNYYDFNNVTASSVIPFSSSDKLDTNILFASGTMDRVDSIGARFKSNNLFATATDYQTIDWTSIPGYESDPLYNKIADAFDSSLRLNGSDFYLYRYDNSPIDSGFAAFIRFSPDIDVTGYTYNLFDSGVLFASYELDLSYALSFENGHLTAQAKNTDGQIIKVIDSNTYDDYTYPLSVAITYSENRDNKLRLYTDNENPQNDNINLRGVSNAFEINNITSNPLTIGFAPGSGIGMNMFVTDFGIEYTSGVDFNNSLETHLITDFLGDIRVPYKNHSNQYTLWNRVDENVDHWILGAFRECQFGNGFDKLSKRVGNDYVFHYLKSDGIAYEQRCNIDLPANVPSGLAYHTQIENDMLRFSLGFTDKFNKDTLYSPLPRISKNLPRGYKFEEDAIAVETILEYESLDTVQWENGNLGPRLTVSLYTTNKDPQSYEASNYGLVNRYFHYLEPSGCIRKLTSVFDANSFFDEETETWSNFNSLRDQKISELKHKYYSKDIDDMFVQYDIAYPSGSSFESIIKLHSLNVKLNNALVESDDLENHLDLFVSGQKITRDSLNLNTLTHIQISDDLNLFASGVRYESSGVLNMFASGGYPVWDYLNLYQPTVGGLDNIGGQTFGSSDPTIGFRLFIDGRIQDGKYLPLYLDCDAYEGVIEDNFNLMVYNKPARSYESNQLGLRTISDGVLVSSFPFSKMGLFTKSYRLPETSFDFANLYTQVADSVFELENNSMSLHTINYNPPLGDGDQSINWTGKKFGVSIDVDDNIYSFLDANDEIRGVTTICYGDCNEGGTCVETAVVTHDTVWRDETCIDGGIFRPINVYTNPNTSAFRTDVGYYNNFYGIRKYDGLIPNAPYSITITGRTADGRIVNVPREIETIEYGVNENVAFSGTKFVADDPSIIDGRIAGDKYGKSVSVSNDIFAIGAPGRTIQDESGNDILNAGTVFVYRRDQEPQGITWNYDKADWNLEAELRLPFASGDYVKNYVNIDLRDSSGKIVGSVTERVWSVGQEGREFGHSVSTSVANNREIVAIGGPGAKWSRTFDDLNATPVNIGLCIFTDEFTPEYAGGLFEKPTTYTKILSAIKDKDIFFKYFTLPYPVKFNVKVLVFDCNADTDGYVEKQFNEPKPDGFVYTKLSHRHHGNQEDANAQGSLILADMISLFEEAFPYDETKLNNNIPALMGFHIDKSDSFTDPSTGISAVDPELDQFIRYYQNYSLDNGLVDFYGNPTRGGVAKFYSNSENWITESISALNYVLDTKRIIDDDQMRFFGTSLTQFNQELDEFNTPPASGGAVYIFENENDSWNLIQIIDSPNDSNITPTDRFGHAVKMSKNGEVLVVGSPYTNEAFGVYQYDPREKERMYKNIPTWVEFHRNTDKSYGYYWGLKDTFDSFIEQDMTEEEASRELYNVLTPLAKHDLRTNTNYWGESTTTTTETSVDFLQGYYQTSKTGPIQEYEKVFSYTYGNIPYIGTWGLILDNYCPTSRLGYSVAVNEDGSIVAAGAPTDSLNENDDKNVYYWQSESDGTIKANSTWASYVNAGAVRLFESRQYFPHNLVVDYGKFGNLSYENRLENEDQYFDHLKAIFEEDVNSFTNIRRRFVKTSFEEVDIPEEAGLVIIRTPAVDALSDEILTNIKDWLALGDRHLVLVGEDPEYERNGLYKESNDVINKILDGLNSRVRIHPARNNFEALYIDANVPVKPNVIASTIPGTPRGRGRLNYINIMDMYGHGVGDIRMHSPEKAGGYACTLSNDPFYANADIGVDDSYQALNGKCKIPMYHNGDLRAEWNEVCYTKEGKRRVHPNNWGLLFGTYKPEDYGCYVGDDPTPDSPTAGYDPVPLLAAAEYPEPYDIVYPAVPPASSLVPVEWKDVPVDTKVSAKFGLPLNDEKQFVWSDTKTVDGEEVDETQGIIAASICIGDTNNPFKFQDPFEYNGINALLQGVATDKITFSTGKESIYSPVVHTARESIKVSDNKNIPASILYLIAGLNTESKTYLSSAGDTNLRYYRNMISDGYAIGTKLNIAQLGLWTGRTRFKDANQESDLKAVLSSFHPYHRVYENVVRLNNPKRVVQNQDGNLVEEDIEYDIDICWIASPQDIPKTDQEVSDFLNWFKQGNKKIIITYEQIGNNEEVYTSSSDDQGQDIDYTIVNNTVKLCQILNSTMEPFYLPQQARYALSNSDANGSDNYLTINDKSYIGTGNPAIDGDEIERLSYSDVFVPINYGEGQAVAFYPYSILDTVINSTTNWQMRAGVAELKVPVIPGSGYKLFIDLVSHKPTEDSQIVMDVSNCSRSPKIGGPSQGQSKELFEFDSQDEKVVIKSDTIGFTDFLVSPSFDGSVGTKSYLIQTANNVDSMSIYMSANNLLLGDSDVIPRTSRVVAISGCLVEIEKETKIIYERVVTKYDWVITSEGSPERIVTVTPPRRQISTDNTKYCPTLECAEALGNQLIEDGPIVVAQELEQFSNFKYGENRSRVTVISDSSLIQGRCIANEDGSIRDSVRLFLQSLYPPNPSVSSRGRSFNISTKIVSSERMSPHKLVASTRNPGHNLLFLGNNSSITPTIDLYKYDEYLYDPTKEDPGRRPREVREALEYDFLIDLPENVKRTDEDIKQIEEQVLNTFDGLQSYWGGTSKFSGVIEGKMYADASYRGGIPEIMKDTGYDYLDFERFPSGYPGDLFGYSIDLYGEKLVIGAPFVVYSGENITPWESISSSLRAGDAIPGTLAGYNGGAGAVYIYEKTGSGLTPQGNLISWACNHKLRPRTINVGQDLTSIDGINNSDEPEYLGPNNYTADDLSVHTIVGDQFGRCVDIEADVLAIGAPGHDFENYIYESGGAFMNKAFGGNLNITLREVYDVGESGFRNELFEGGSGTTSVLNNGAVYVYENRIYDWPNKLQRWEFVEKIVQQGNESRLQKDYEGSDLTAVSGSENDYFGQSIGISRVRRTDSDYQFVFGVPNHKFSNTENEGLLDAGAAYEYDVILREKEASRAHPDAFIQAKVFGGSGTHPVVRIAFKNGGLYNEKYEATGVVYSNPQGEIFIEGSGYDPLTKGFVSQRPYISSVKGDYVYGVPFTQSFKLFIEGQPPVQSGDMAMFIDSEYGIVYNNVGMYLGGVNDVDSGVLRLYTDCPSPVEITESDFFLYASGIGLNTDTLNFTIRGR